MRSSRTISLFTEQPEQPKGVSAFVASMVAHSFVVALVILAFMYSPQFRLRTPDVYMLQHVELNRPDPPIRAPGGSGSMSQNSPSAGSTSSAHENLAAPPSSRLQLDRRKLAPQTLVQPDIDPDRMLPKEIPLPSLMLWSSSKVKLKVITPPAPQPLATTFDKPKLSFPNKEVHLAELNLASTPFQSKLPTPLPSNTTPIVVHQEAPTQRVPETTSVSAKQPTAAAVLSASDLHMAQGSVPMPPANESALGNLQGALGAGRSAASVQPGNGGSGSMGTDHGSGKGEGNSGGQAAGSGNAGAQKGSGNGSNGNGSEPGAGAGQGTGHGPGAGSTQGTGQGTGQGDDRSVSRITLPKNGQFGVVVVGSTMDEQFPETAAVWKGRMAYSVYLHVGTSKNWILQYSMPRAADSASAGTARLEAPWPFYIVRPNLDPDEANADAVMVHGFVNEAGHFEALAVVFPNGFAHEQLVLGALQQWQFRPGAQNGQIARLEVLLIIPE